MSSSAADVEGVEAAARPTPSSVRRGVPTAGSTGPGASGTDLTGDDQVDQALTVLDGLPEAPLRTHVAAFDAVHAALQDRLADTEGASA